MKSLTANTILFFTSLSLVACGGASDDTNTSSTYQQPSSSICDASSTESNGLLCAIQPSRLESSSRDFFSDENTGDFLLGFGYHAIAFPKTGTEMNGVNIHFSGSYDRPYNQISNKFGSSLFLNESLSAGYINIQLAYNNRYSINLDECGDLALLSVDNCSGDAREEKITGQNVSAVVDTPVADSIEYRLIKLVEYLQNEGVIFPLKIVSNGSINWNLLRVSGHSQGATHALYLSKYYATAHACLLAGGYDIADTTPVTPPENMADWLLDESVPIDTSKVTALVSTDDEYYDSFNRTYNQIGLVQGTHYETFSDAPYFTETGTEIRGHSAVMFDPRFSDMREMHAFFDS